jgi:hypothetical protein
VRVMAGQVSANQMPRSLCGDIRRRAEGDKETGSKPIESLLAATWHDADSIRFFLRIVRWIRVSSLEMSYKKR